MELINQFFKWMARSTESQNFEKMFLHENPELAKNAADWSLRQHMQVAWNLFCTQKELLQLKGICEHLEEEVRKLSFNNAQSKG